MYQVYNIRSYLCQIIIDKMEDMEREEDWEEDLSGNDDEVKLKNIT